MPGVKVIFSLDIQGRKSSYNNVIYRNFFNVRVERGRKSVHNEMSSLNFRMALPWEFLHAGYKIFNSPQTKVENASSARLFRVDREFASPEQLVAHS